MTVPQTKNRLGEKELKDRGTRLCCRTKELVPHSLIGIGLTPGAWANVGFKVQMARS
jgi:hypothetical protein